MLQLSKSRQLDSFLSQKIKTPSYRPDRTASQADRLFSRLDLFCGKALSKEDAQSIAQIMSEFLGVCGPASFLPALQYFRTHPLTKLFLKFLCQQISASKKALKEGKPFDVFRGAYGFEWAPFKVVDVIHDPEGSRYHILGQFTDGRPCGIPFDMIRKNVNYGFYIEAGISKRALRGVKLDSRDIVGFHYTALLEYREFFPLDFANEKIKRLDTRALAGVRCTASQATLNNRLYTERLEPCPFRFKHTCSKCFIGYDNCPRGCRPETNWAAHKDPTVEITLNVSS